MCEFTKDSYPGEQTVTCPSATYRRKITVSRYKVNFIAEVTLEDESAKQTVATVFPATIKTMLNMKKGVELEDNLLSLEEHAFVLNKKRL